MGFNGGGGGQLLNHEHDGTLVADGGPLDFKNVTQSGMSAGSITQSDGVHLQELSIGLASQLVRVNGAGTALEYYTPATPSTLVWEQLDRHLSTTNESTYTYTSALDLDTTYNSILITGHGLADASLALQCKISGLTEYHTTTTDNILGTVTNQQLAGAAEIELLDNNLINSSRNFNYAIYISKAKASATTENNSYWGQSMALTRGWRILSGGTVAGGNVDITSIEIKTSTSTWSDGTLLEVYGLKQS